MSNAAMQERLSGVRSRLFNENRVSLSEFARGKAWRQKLAEKEFMELQEHGDRVAWIISEEGMRGLFEYITELEEQAERASIHAMFEARESCEEWESGSRLEQEAIAYFREHEGELMKEANSG